MFSVRERKKKKNKKFSAFSGFSQHRSAFDVFPISIPVPTFFGACSERLRSAVGARG